MEGNRHFIYDHGRNKYLQLHSLLYLRAIAYWSLRPFQVKHVYLGAGKVMTL
jgi:hypothetical protein